MTPEQRAQLKIQREMDSRTTRSIFDGRGQLDRHAAESLSQGNTYLAEYLDLSSIPFAPDPYGSDHGVQLSRLVEYMATLTTPFGGLGPFDQHDSRILHATALLYACGMAQGREGYEARSAAIADKYFREGGGAGTYWAKQEVREETCRLIYKHTDKREIANDKRLQVFEDAVRFEVARFDPNDRTGKSIAVLKEAWKPELFHQGWAKDKANARAWMLNRGWH